MVTKSPKSTKAKKAVKATKSAVAEQTGNSADEAMIAEAAYYRAESRGFSPGLEIEDWLEAEKKINQVQIKAQV